MSSPVYHEQIITLRAYAQKLNWFQLLFFPDSVMRSLHEYPLETPDHAKAFQVYSTLSQSSGFFNWIGKTFLSGLKRFTQDIFTQTVNTLDPLTEDTFIDTVRRFDSVSVSMASSLATIDTSSLVQERPTTPRSTTPDAPPTSPVANIVRHNTPQEKPIVQPSPILETRTTAPLPSPQSRPISMTPREVPIVQPSPVLETRTAAPRSSSQSMPPSMLQPPTEQQTQSLHILSACSKLSQEKIRELWKQTKEQNVTSIFYSTEAESTYRAIQKIYSTRPPSQDRKLYVLAALHHYAIINGQPKDQDFAKALNREFNLNLITRSAIENEISTTASSTQNQARSMAK